jgi:pimeloyl-ACP methyl ester carboxylesterase
MNNSTADDAAVAGTVVIDTPFFQLICVKESNEHPDTVALGAIAGHKIKFSLDYKKGKSVLESSVKYSKGGVYYINVKPPIWAGIFTVTYDTWLDQVAESIKFIDNGPVRLVGICQGGMMAAIFATRNPDLVSELIIAATPINTSTPSSISPSQEFPFIAYQWAIMLNGGIMPGDVLLKAWWSANAEHHEIESKKPENAYFYARYKETQGISGIPFLTMIRKGFLSLEFFNELDIRCPVQVIIGRKDKETPPEQTLAIAKRCRILPITEHYTDGGHMSTFASGQAHKPGGVWSEIFSG